MLQKLLDGLKAFLQSLTTSPKITEMKYVPLSELKDIIKDTPIKDSLLDLMCLAIRDFEGKPGDRNYKNNNPGNAKYSPQGYLPKYGKVLRDAQNFAIFSSYEIGWLYLQNLVLNKAKKHPEWNLVSFFREYAPVGDNNEPVGYATFVAKRMGVNTFTWQLKNLL